MTDTTSKSTDITLISSRHEIVKPRWAKLEYIWQIDNFWEIRALGSIEALHSTNGDIIWSQRFGSEEHGVWRLKCYPFGDTSAAGRSNVSLFLSLDTDTFPDMKAYAIFGCSILDDHGEKIPGSGRSFTRQKFSAESNSWGWSQFIKVEGHSLSRMLANNQQSLVVRCEVDVFLSIERCPGFDAPAPRSLSADIVAYAAKPENCDVEIHYGRDGNETYQANSFVLSARSTFFDKLLKLKTAPVPAKRASVAPTLEDEDDDVFGSFEEVNDVNDGALYLSFQPTKTATTKKRIKDSYIETNSVAKLTVDENRNKVITIDPNFEKAAVLAYLTHIHVGENAFTSKTTYPSSGSTISQICQLAQLAHRTSCASLYWECVMNLAGRMVTKEDSVVINALAKDIECHQLEEHSRIISTGCFRHSDKDELLRLMLPKSAQEQFRELIRSRPRRE